MKLVSLISCFLEERMAKTATIQTRVDPEIKRNAQKILSTLNISIFEDDASEMNDSELLNRANELGRVLFTQGNDLLAEAAKRQKNGIFFQGVIMHINCVSLLVPVLTIYR
jgi:hypothetical protein